MTIQQYRGTKKICRRCRIYLKENEIEYCDKCKRQIEESKHNSNGKEFK
jgi:hypothetical protein